jgi:hypothetical protein
MWLLSLLRRHFLLVHVLLLVWFLTWVHGGTRPEHLRSVPWLLFLLGNALLMLPHQRGAETLPAARVRMGRSLLQDPVLWLGSALIVLLVLQGVYPTGLLPSGEGQSRTVLAALNRWIPFSINGAEARQLLDWFPPALAALLAVRHGLNRQGRRALLHGLVWTGALLAVFGWIQEWSGTHALYGLTPLPAHFFASFGYENHAGAYFTLLFTISGGLWFQTQMDKEGSKRAWRLLFPLLLNLSGVFGSRSRASMVLSILILAGGGLACILASWTRLQRAPRIAAIVFAVLIVTLSLGIFRYMPQTGACAELATVRPATIFQDAIGDRLMQYRSAWAMWCDFPVFGVGGWGYRYLLSEYVTPDELHYMKQANGKANVHNDALQFLAEHGLVGFGLMLAVIGVVLHPVVRGMLRAWRTVPVVDWDHPYVPLLLRVPATVYAILLGATATLIQSLIDLPFRSPAILITWTLCLACASAFLPRQVLAEGATAAGQTKGRRES